MNCNRIHFFANNVILNPFGSLLLCFYRSGRRSSQSVVPPNSIVPSNSVVPPNSRLVMGYFSASSSAGTFCDENDNCSQCSVEDNNEYRANQPWPRVMKKNYNNIIVRPRSTPRSSAPRSSARSQASYTRSGGGRLSKNSHNGLKNSNNSRYVTTTTMTTTKTLVSLKSCRSLSEIETLPPTGYFASTVVQSTYVNDDFVSDNNDEDPRKQNSCCKER